MKREDLDGVIDIDAPAEDQTEPEQLEQLKRESAGKDRKVSELQRQIKALEERTDAGGDHVVDDKRLEQLGTIREMMATLQERERNLDAQSRALNQAIEKAIPVGLAVRNADDWESFEKDVAELAGNITEGMRWKANRKQSVKSKEGLDLARIGKMTKREIGRIPDVILNKLMEGKKA